MCPRMALADAPSVDNQFWSELDATHAISEDLTATAIVTTRLGNDLPNPALTAGGVQIDCRLGSWTASGTGYYVSIRSAESGARTEIWLPAVALTYQYTMGRLALSDRNRLEQLEGLPGAPIRYRNRAGADWHVAGVNELTEVFIADEVFYDLSRDRWTRNRAQAGLQFQPGEATKLQVFYMRQNSTFGIPERLNVLGLTLQLDIK
jgi:hypothetical protein